MKVIYHNLYQISIACLCTLLLACSNQTEPHTEMDQNHENQITLSAAQFEQADIELGEITQKTIGSELRVNGIIDVPPQSNVSINMPYGGFIKYTEMLPGTPVNKGQLLVTIENPDFIQFQQEYLEGLANQEFLKAEYDRQNKLFEENVASAKNFQQARSAYQVNEVRIKTAAARLRMIGMNPDKLNAENIGSSVGIYAPVSGQVREVHANIGKYVHPQDVIMNITNSEDLHVELTVYESDIPKVAIGQRIRFALADSPENWREAEIFQIGSGVREDRSVTVHGHLKQHESGMLPGMYVTAVIETGSDSSWAVPEDAIVRFDGKHFIFSMKGKETSRHSDKYEFEMVEVLTGAKENGYTRIDLVDSTLIESNIQLVTNGAFAILAKAKNTEEEGGHGH